MRVLFTGASSFTGFWFIQELAAAGHEVVAIFRSPASAYQGVRLRRLQKIVEVARPVFECVFGSSAFLTLVKEQPWDLFCHHAAEVTDYKSPHFDPVAALANNSHHVPQVLSALVDRGCPHLLLTGSVFEQREGAGSDQLRAVSPYGLSKGLTSDLFAYYASVFGMKLGKFVIPNPFGPYEEQRFTSFLIQKWFSGEVAQVTQPAYVRDNIHVSLLAKAYRFFAEQSHSWGPFQKMNPSGYPESQGAFTRRFAEEMSHRLGLPCEFQLQRQTEFPEPKVRMNTDILDHLGLGWNELDAWDSLAHYYQTTTTQTAHR